MDFPVVPLADIDLSSREFWAMPRDWREGAFMTLRNEAPFQFFDEYVMADSPFPPGRGYRALTRHDDIWHVSRNASQFRNRQGSSIGDLPVELKAFFSSMVDMDDSEHFRLRSIVTKGFGPREIARVEDQVKIRAAKVIDRLLSEFSERTCDFVEQVAAPMPLQIICDMMGVPESDHSDMFRWTNTLLGVGDPDFVLSYNDLIAAGMEIFAYAQALGEDRKANPRDDITSVMMAAEVDGQSLTTLEFSSFFILLIVAGNETTRNVISHGMKLLTDNPDQKKIWFNDFDTHNRTAVEELVRMSTPIIHARRTALHDTEINGQKILEGEKVVMFYSSGNRDERTFANPQQFNITREIAPAQIGFGAGGPHFCLGANLARREVSVMFNEIARRIPTLRTEGEPAYLQNQFINGIKRLQCSW